MTNLTPPDEISKRDWRLFALFLVREMLWPPGAPEGHINWLLQERFKTLSDWLGEEGAAYRKRRDLREPTERFKQWWAEFRPRTPTSRSLRLRPSWSAKRSGDIMSAPDLSEAAP